MITWLNAYIIEFSKSHSSHIPLQISLPPSLSPSLPPSIPPLPHSLPPSLPPYLPLSLTYSLPHSLTHSLPPSLTPSLTHSLMPSLPLPPAPPEFTQHPQSQSLLEGEELRLECQSRCKPGQPSFLWFRRRDAQSDWEPVIDSFSNMSVTQRIESTAYTINWLTSVHKRIIRMQQRKFEAKMTSHDLQTAVHFLLSQHPLFGSQVAMYM